MNDGMLKAQNDEVLNGMMSWKTGDLNKMMKDARRSGEDTSLYMMELERRVHSKRRKSK